MVYEHVAMWLRTLVFWGSGCAESTKRGSSCRPASAASGSASRKRPPPSFSASLHCTTAVRELLQL